MRLFDNRPILAARLYFCVRKVELSYTGQPMFPYPPAVETPQDIHPENSNEIYPHRTKWKNDCSVGKTSFAIGREIRKVSAITTTETRGYLAVLLQRTAFSLCFHLS